MLYLLMINASMYYGKQVRRLVQQENLSIYFLITYCSELAPVETAFSLTKQKIITSNKEKKFSFQKDEGKQAILEALWELCPTTIWKIWLEVIKVAKEWIIEWAMQPNRSILE